MRQLVIGKELDCYLEKKRQYKEKAGDPIFGIFQRLKAQKEEERCQRELLQIEKSGGNGVVVLDYAEKKGGLRAGIGSIFVRKKE